MLPFLQFLFAGLITHAIYGFFEPRRLRWHFLLDFVVPLTYAYLVLPRHLHSVLNLVTSWSIYASSLIISTTAYRLSPFHPLWTYPGPILCKITKMHLAFISLNGKQHLYIQSLHRRYGDVVRTGPNELSFCRPDFIVPMFGCNGLPKSSFWDGQLAHQEDFRAFLGIRDPKTHARRRQMWARGFTSEAIRSYSPTIIKRVGQLLEHLGTQTGEVIDLTKWINWFSYDVMNDVVFGDDIQVMETQDALGRWNAMVESDRTALFVAHIPWITHLFLKIPSVRWKNKEFRESGRLRVLKRVKADPNGTTTDLFHYLRGKFVVNSSPLTIEQAINDASMMMKAGVDTVSAALCSIFYLLICNPVVYARLQSEIDSSLLTVDDVDNLTQLLYLDAVLKETLRLLPPVPGGTSRSSPHGCGDLLLGPYYIPEGTTVGIHTYTMQRDPRNFFMPEKYLPERWLPMEIQQKLEPQLFEQRQKIIHNVNAFLPFSYGPTDCIGKRFAMRELRVATFALLRQFNLRFADGYTGTRWEEDLCDFFVTRIPGLYVVLSPR